MYEKVATVNVVHYIPSKLLVIFSKTTGAYPGFGRGGGQEIFFQIWKFACRERNAAHCEAMRFARVGLGACPPEKFF